MKRVILYVMAAVIVVAGLGAAVTRLRQPARELAADLKIINADTGDVMSSATYQRFAARREAVAANAGRPVGIGSRGVDIRGRLGSDDELVHRTLRIRE